VAHPASYEQCLDILAEIEAQIDFEEDLPRWSRVMAQIEQLLAEVSKIIATGSKVNCYTGLKVAIVGVRRGNRVC